MTRNALRIVSIAAAFVLLAASAQAQTTVPNDHGVRPHAAPQVDVRARMALLDERIAMLTADMKMFAGEMKIQTMAELIEAIVERQRLVERELRSMRERMRDHMNHDSPPAPPLEMEPDAMCSPHI